MDNIIKVLDEHPECEKYTNDLIKELAATTGYNPGRIREIVDQSGELARSSPMIEQSQGGRRRWNGVGISGDKFDSWCKAPRYGCDVDTRDTPLGRTVQNTINE